MLAEAQAGAADISVNKEIKKIIISMSGLHIGHKATVAVCYEKYFQQKTREFHDIEKLIRVIIRSSKSKELATIAGDIKIMRREFRKKFEENFNYIQTEGFDLGQWHNGTVVVKATASHYKCIRLSDLRNTIRKTEMNTPAWNDDHFCDYILKDDNGDNGIKMVGYGMINTNESPNLVDVPMVAIYPNTVDNRTIAQSPKMVNSPKISIPTSATSVIIKTVSSAKSATIGPKIDKSGVATSSGSSIASGNSVNTRKASKIPKSKQVIKASTSGIIKRSPKIDKSNIVKSESAAVVKPQVVGESSGASGSQCDVLPMQVDQENVDKLIKSIPPENSRFPMRLRLKRYLAEMTVTENLPNANNSNSDETETKKRRRQ